MLVSSKAPGARPLISSVRPQSMRIAILLISLLWTTTSVAHKYIAFFGTPSSQRYLPHVEYGCPGVCMDVVYRWRIRVNSHVSGPGVHGTIRAAMIQHTEYIYANGRRALFVIYKIEDAKRRKLLGADYWIAEYSPPKTVYCLSESAEKFDIPQGENEVIGKYLSTDCYERHGERP